MPKKKKAVTSTRSLVTKAGFAPAKAGAKTIVGIKVKFELNSKNGLRRIKFGLEKDTNGDKVTWTITFQLFERAKKTDAYTDPLVSLEILIDSKLNKKAEAAAKNGLTQKQAAHAMGPAAEDAKLAEAGEIEQEEADETIQATLKKS